MQEPKPRNTPADEERRKREREAALVRFPNTFPLPIPFKSPQRLLCLSRLFLMFCVVLSQARIQGHPDLRAAHLAPPPLAPAALAAVVASAGAPLAGPEEDDDGPPESLTAAAPPPPPAPAPPAAAAAPPPPPPPARQAAVRPPPAAKAPPPQEPGRGSLLAKLLDKDIRRERSHLLQFLRYLCSDQHAA